MVNFFKCIEADTFGILYPVPASSTGGISADISSVPGPDDLPIDFCGSMVPSLVNQHVGDEGDVLNLDGWKSMDQDVVIDEYSPVTKCWQPEMPGTFQLPHWWNFDVHGAYIPCRDFPGQSMYVDSPLSYGSNSSDEITLPGHYLGLWGRLYLSTSQREGGPASSYELEIHSQYIELPGICNTFESSGSIIPVTSAYVLEFSEVGCTEQKGSYTQLVTNYDSQDVYASYGVNSGNLNSSNHYIGLTGIGAKGLEFSVAPHGSRAYVNDIVFSYL